MFTGPTRGISREGDIVDLGVDLEIIKKLGAFFSYGELRLGQGREAAKEYLRQNQDVARELEELIVAGAMPVAPLPAGVSAAPSRNGNKPDLEAVE
jgi:recombination protein RecA